MWSEKLKIKNQKSKTQIKNLKIFAFAFFIFYILSFILAAAPALAQVTSDVSGLALAATDPRIIAAKIIRVALSFLGTIALALVLYGGFLWMTSAGNEEKIEKARKILINAAIGLAIILSALAITQFIIGRLLSALGAPALPPPAPAPGRVGGGALGSGIVESHYPRRGQINVARNTRIIISFKQAINPATLEKGVQIIKTADIKGSVRQSSAEKYVQFTATNTEDQRTFVLDPAEFLGSAQESVGYTVYLCGTVAPYGNCEVGGIKLASGGSAFVGRFGDYQWSFDTGTFLDTEPPRISAITPLPDNFGDVQGTCPAGQWNSEGQFCHRRDKPRNILVQIRFNEPILPTVSSGKTQVLGLGGALTDAGGTAFTQGMLKPGTFQVLRARLKESGSTYLAGQWQLGNQYTTAEFTPTELCGRNSCGGDVFCLPGAPIGPDGIAVEALAATLAKPGDPGSAGLFDGLEDLAGNSLDGNSNGLAQGPTDFFNLNVEDKTKGDNVLWSFFTSDVIDLTSPQIEQTSPDINGAGVPPASPIEITFTKPMSAATLNSENIVISGAEQATGRFWDTWWTLESQNLPPEGDPQKTRADIKQGGLWAHTDYISSVRSEVKDLYQNCFFPSGGTAVCTDLSETRPYCCNGTACAAGDAACNVCGF